MSGPGLRFRKLDLHVHSPASKDFRDRNVSADQIVDRAIEVGLDAIAITDHNSGEWIDKVKAAAKRKGLTVLPGVEISCDGGVSGLHVIALFDVDKGSAHVSHLLSRLGIRPDKQGKTDALAEGTLADVITIIQSDVGQGIAIPAHVNSSKGILADMKGEQRTRIINNGELLAVEARCFGNENLESKNRRAIDIFGGKHPDYPRQLAVYQASDNPTGTPQGGHGLSRIGSCCAHFKMEEINLESLVQCFLDPEVRIIQDFEYKNLQYPTINKIFVSGGFLEGQTANFNAGLNSVVGGKGTGKSLLIELMRFALNQAPARSEFSNDHNTKLEGRLKEGSYVELEFSDETGKLYPLKRIYRLDNSYYETAEFEPSQLFPVLFLSQNEIIRIAETETEQLNFIDQFFDFRSYTHSIETIERSLAESDIRLAESIRANREYGELQRRIGTAQLELSRFENQLSHPIFANYQVAEQKNRAFESQISGVAGVVEALSEAQGKITIMDPPAIPDALSEDDTITRNQDKIAEAKETAISQLEALKETLGGFHSAIESKQKTWSKTFQSLRSDYDEHVRVQGGDYQELAGKRARAISQIEGYKRQLQQLTRQKEALPTIRADRDKALDDLARTYNAYRTVRRDRCDQIQTNSKGKLRLSIEGASNTEAFKRRLMEMKTGTHIHEPYIDSIASKVQPRDFVEFILRSQIEAIESSAILTELANKTGVSLANVLKLTTFLSGSDKLEELLQLQYKVYPQDRPQIEFKVGDDKFFSLHSLSVGQKSTALLIMALSDGQMPVIIDQPEDSLDIRSIWDDICFNVRTNKSSRQFIFTTHNSNVAVASDSDNFIILDADSERGWITHNGSMDHSPVSDEVLTYMEGGLDSYHRKSAKYQADLRTNRN